MALVFYSTRKGHDCVVGRHLREDAGTRLTVCSSAFYAPAPVGGFGSAHAVQRLVDARSALKRRMAANPSNPIANASAAAHR